MCSSVRLFVTFLPRGAMLAVHAVVMCSSVCLSVCLTQAGIVSKRLEESSWFFGADASFLLSYTVSGP